MEQNLKKLNISVTLLRILIGWHFLFEGVVKMYNPDWTSFGYLATAQGPFDWFFTFLLGNVNIGLVNTLNIVALMVVGITFTLGIFERLGAIVGIGLLALYFMAHPPFPGLTQMNVEGSYWLVNKNLIELVACLVIYQLPTGRYFGLDYLRKNKLKIQET
ncbi:DoxX family protein [Flagellimonas zhangzhouensis]|uniref:Thiosulfate dehydrogenase [quinone] large subunit n=1 Tax=Flagellimonas zhangzhouensis TaxID=1073328 RepID=A0A1H2Z8P1_9FLAO|nr:DoxX family membrane protein [Allomuricauda zhangzhouensis]SDR07915.1 thiosulfate dehydrogenase [quinone] large subunit [Allomuricauda zhangzhouensis]SDX13695.1 thiosulfate dehydrogenase [quinone] large subunit [Allomuricauda zhangzhouensis]